MKIEQIRYLYVSIKIIYFPIINKNIPELSPTLHMLIAYQSTTPGNVIRE